MLSNSSPEPTTIEENVHVIEKILAIRQHDEKKYVLIKHGGIEKAIWTKYEDCPCREMIEEFENNNTPTTDDVAWEVERVINKRVRLDGTGFNEYLLKWRDWPGSPTWEPEETVLEDCHRLVASYENPKLAKLLDLSECNTELWVGPDEVNEQAELIVSNRPYFNYIRFEPDLPLNETPAVLKEGVNIGVVLYCQHWYLVIIFINHLTITKRLSIADPLNLLCGPKIDRHPLYRRFSTLYPQLPIWSMRMAQMTRSDMCAFYVLAAIERSLFIYDRRAQYAVNEIQFDESRPEEIRAAMRPNASSSSVQLKAPRNEAHGLYCEFCKRYYNVSWKIDAHIRFKHFKR